MRTISLKGIELAVVVRDHDAKGAHGELLKALRWDLGGGRNRDPTALG
jgi:hypothetical protein